MKQQTEICSPTVTATSAPKAVGGRDATFPEAGRRGRRSVSALGPARPCAVSRLPLAAAGPGRAEAAGALRFRPRSRLQLCGRAGDGCFLRSQASPCLSVPESSAGRLQFVGFCGFFLVCFF